MSQNGSFSHHPSKAHIDESQNDGAKPGRLIGYARVSTDDQEVGVQRDALLRHGCVEIYADMAVSGSARSRPQLDACLRSLTAGDTLVVWKLDRLGRSAAHLALLLDDFQRRGIAFRSLTEALDSASPSGRMMGNLLAAFAQYERELISERTRATLLVKRQRGEPIGRPRSLSLEQERHARELAAAGEPKRRIARILGVHHATVYRALNRSSKGSQV
jgi:DNA invertase Pin-like site-specific DNA recombinase